MAQWYYVDAAHHRHGPVEAAVLAQAYRRGELTRESLVWRDGLAQWSPLGDFLAELGPAEPPPAPPGEPAGAAAEPPPAAAAAATEIDRSDIVDAGFLRRFAAFIIDSMIVGGVFYFFYIIGLAFVLAVATRGGEDDGAAAATGMLLISLIYPVLSLGYFATMESSKLQATVGKMALSIKVVDAQGNRLGWGHAAGRWLASLLSYLTLYIGFFMAGFTRRKQALHDLVAGTFVVDKWAYTDQPGRQQREPGGCLIAIVIGAALMLVLAVAGIVAAISIPAYQDYLTRSKVAVATGQGRALAVAVAEFRANTDRCPRDPEEIAQPTSFPPAITGVRLFEDAAGQCVVALELGDRDAVGEAAGGQVFFRLGADGAMRCEGSGVPYNALPADCR